ncbi:MAG: response regulator transcription factor [Candidatus Woesearchaeota archaeon]
MKKILYVEDNLDTARAVQIILKNAGYDVYLAHTGSDCLKKTKESCFDLILLDVMLPDMSGWEIFNKVKENASTSKYAFISAIPASNERIVQIRQEGICDYIMKPFKSIDLVKRVDKIFIE